ncbi:alpha/beta fold hydrolase [Rufibacter sediminis]|uniref:Alpha/beta hydrolase n=1 Tax=Rufibacter sediminis TaxID=2762756 RepID=A0ABR6VU37_9BACT|nr:alpha/beta hydrolase [Rufibacter sediminis]MBC3540710.1 alpha/beta hydrolase [Rufibacter sediminis]
MEPLLLLHGALGAKDQFEPLLPLLSPALPVYSFNLAGHGGAPFSGEDPFTIEGFAHQLLEWLEAHAVPPVQVVGYSMGGYIALEAARQQPTRFSRILTLAAKFNWTAETARHEAAKLQPEVISLKVPAFAQTLQTRHAPQDWTLLLHRTAEMMRQLGQKPTLSAEVLAQINVPVCVAVGDRDQMVSVEESLAAYRQLPQGQFTVLPNTKHPLEQLHWPLFASVLHHFFSYA